MAVKCRPALAAGLRRRVRGQRPGLWSRSIVNKTLVTVLLLPFLAIPAARGQDSDASSIVEQVGDTAFMRIEVRSFATLDARQQKLAYWLAQAAIAIDPIVYDQFSRFGLRQKRLLEGIVAHVGKEAADARIIAYAKLFWANRGNHNLGTSRKFLPSFTFEELARAAQAARKRGAFAGRHASLPPLGSAAQLDLELNALRASIFDPDFEPMLTAKSPAPGQDILRASANTFYEGVTLADLNGFTETHALNSRLVRARDGTLHERIDRAGTADGKFPPGLYALFLRRANGFLVRAQAFADPAQAKVIGDLIRYFETGRFADWLRFGTDWVRNDDTVDFANGFIEVYRDARGAKGSASAFVSITDKPLTRAMNRLAANADYFERKAPWDDAYKRQSFTPPVIKAVETIVETGDMHVIVIGDNLPNENPIREKYGSKNFLFISVSHAYTHATGYRDVREFFATPQLVARKEKYGDEAEDLSTALHEVIGHGSGKLSERLQGGAGPYLKEYASTLEEARADLMALWNTWDPKLKELGLISSQEEVSRAMYDACVVTALVQLHEIPVGDTIEEDHARNRQLIVHFIRDRVPGAIEQFQRDGKTYVEVRDYTKMREGVGILLAELMRIKAEGDYAAIKALVDRYGVHFDPALRDEVSARYRKLGLPTYWAGINAQLTADFGPGGAIRAVHLSYPRSAEEQYLHYGSMYDRALRALPPAGDRR